MSLMVFHFSSYATSVQYVIAAKGTFTADDLTDGKLPLAKLEELTKKGLLSYLPDELELTARTRMEHKDLSLAQLAAIMTPPISKPGLSHRLKKITAIAEELLNRGAK